MTENSKNYILTIDQATKLLQVSPWTVCKLVSTERTPGKIY